MKTYDKMRYLQDKGYTYESIWECQYDQECKGNDDLTFVEIISPLEPRDAFLTDEPRIYTVQ